MPDERREEGDHGERAETRAAGERGPDEYSPILGQTPREWERGMRFWYVILGIVAFFAVFGEGILLLVSKRRAASAREASAPVVGDSLRR